MRYDDDGVVDFQLYKEARAAGRKLADERDGGEGDIDSELEWASAELARVLDSLEALRDEVLVAESYRMELIAYTAGMEMAKKIIEGQPLADADFWSWLDEKPTDSVQEEEPQLEIEFSPDFEIKEDE